MPTSVKTFFDEKVPAVLEHQPGEGEGRGGGLPVQDHRRRRRDLDGRSRCRRRPRASRASTATPQCTIEASDADFRGMIDGGMQAAMSLFFSGKLKVGGDPMLATKLTKLLQVAG